MSMKDLEALISLLIKVLVEIEDVSRRLNPLAVPRL